jgi:electron transfer flavoprotein beta subunit
LERMLEEGYVRLKTRLPVVITVVKEINEPRLPSLKGKISAKSKKINTWSVKDLPVNEKRLGLTGSPTQVIKIFTPPRPQGGKIFDGNINQAVAEILTELRSAGILLGRAKGEKQE